MRTNEQGVRPAAATASRSVSKRSGRGLAGVGPPSLQTRRFSLFLLSYYGSITIQSDFDGLVLLYTLGQDWPAGAGGRRRICSSLGTARGRAVTPDRARP